MDNTRIYQKRITEDWGKLPESHICHEILSYINKNLSKNISHLTYIRLSEIANLAQVNAPLLKSIQYLCGERVPLLEVKFELIDNGLHHEVTVDEYNQALDDNYLNHPETGEVITDFKNKVHIYFSPKIDTSKFSVSK